LNRREIMRSEEYRRGRRGACFAPASSVSMSDDFKFSLGSRVRTPAGERGVIEHLGRARGRRMYSVRTDAGSVWFEESDLVADDPAE
jgi:hypothetical protein